MATYTIIASGLAKDSSTGQFSVATGAFSMVFDSTQEIAYTYSATNTSHPIDSRSSITDHVIQENDRFTVTGVISNSPINTFAGNLFQYGSGVNRASAGLNKLKSLKEQGALITLSTDFGAVTNCLIKQISGSLTADTKNAYVITLELEKIAIASVAKVIAVALLNETSANSSEGGKDKKDVTLPEDQAERGSRTAAVLREVVPEHFQRDLGWIE